VVTGGGFSVKAGGEAALSKGIRGKYERNLNLKGKILMYETEKKQLDKCIKTRGMS
jgi:hypothetical protein